MKKFSDFPFYNRSREINRQREINHLKQWTTAVGKLSSISSCGHRRGQKGSTEKDMCELTG